MRIRTVKPEFWTDEDLSSVSDFARLLAIALLNYCDDDGYFLSNPIIIRGACFPFLDDSKKILRSLQELSKIGYIDLGKLDNGKDVGRIPNFRKHQRVDKPQPSKFKEKSQFQERSENAPRIVEEHSDSILGGNGMEGNGMEIEGKRIRGKKTNAFAPPTLEEVKQYCKEQNYKFFDCERYLNLRNSNNWVKSNGKKVLDWKNDVNTNQSFGNHQRQMTAEEKFYADCDAFADEQSKKVY